VLWVLGVVGPAAGHLSERVGWSSILRWALVAGLAGVLLTIPASLVSFVPGLMLVTAAMFTVVTTAQIGVSSSTAVDRGVASAVYFSVYYLSGGLGAYVPGLAWQRWGWDGVVAVCATILAVALVAVVATLGSRAGAPARIAA
jgi:YNFM family putative membrane transporter